MDYSIHEMETLRSTNEQKIDEIQCINGQLTKALEVNKKKIIFYILFSFFLFRQFNEQLI
jgi:hypothetical protein